MLLQHLMAHWREQGRRGLAGECSGGGQESPLQPWQSVLRDLCAIDESVNASEQLRQLDAFLATAAITTIDRNALADALNLRSEPQRDLAAAIAATVALLRLLLLRNPMLIVIEDAHWADDHSLALIEALLNAEPAIGSLCLALSYRPLDAATPPRLKMLTGHPAARSVALKPLQDAEAHHLIRTLLGVGHLDPELARYVERYTEGQPLFIREYLRILRQQGLIRIEDDSAKLTQTPSAAQLSNSAQGIIQARIDRLDEPTRLTLKVAAVIGRSFPLRLLAAIHPTQVDEAQLKAQLDHATLRPMIDLELGDPERVYRFSYGIAHEVAYTSLLFGQRRALHAAVVQWYEAEYADELAGGQAPSAVYDLVIEHLRRSENWDSAAAYCRKAAIRAIQHASYEPALHYLDQAIMLAGTPTNRLEPVLTRVALREQIGNYRHQAEDIAELQHMAGQGFAAIDPDLVSIFNMRLALTCGAPEEALQTALDLQARLQRPARSSVRSRLLRAACLAVAAQASADLELAQRCWKHCLRLARSAAEPDAGLPIGLSRSASIGRALIGLAAAASGQGARAKAHRYYQQALDNAHASGDWCGENQARLGLADLKIAQRQHQEAYTLANRALGNSQAIGDRRGHAAALRRLAAIRAASGDPADAQRITWHALAISSLAQDRAAELTTLRDLAHFAELQGQVDEAMALLDEAGLS
ncbi:MAG: AAA family ATPase [Oscillochloris sp.]|nr:AAA family ATPase [Oscillochloris sp.]